MNLIIDVRMVNEHLHGIGRYTYELVNGLIEKDDVNLKLLTNDIQLSKKLFNNSKKLDFIKMKSSFLNPMEIIEFPLVLNKYKKYIFHSPSFASSPFIKIKSYITIHDLNHVALPQYYSKIKQYYYKFAVKPFAKKCEKIFTVSEFSKGEIIKWLNCAEEKVVVTYSGIDDKFQRIENERLLNETKKKYLLPDKFVLYIGNLKKHKNVETLVKAMSKVDNNTKLVINGKTNESISQLINKNNLKDRVRFIGYVDDKDLPAIYSLAEVFVFPSFYEGFGLPPLEAMSCGCPTIVSNTSSLPGVVGNAAILVEPKDEVEFANNINNVINEDTKRLKLIELGYLNAKKFKWNDTVNIIYLVIGENL